MCHNLLIIFNLWDVAWLFFYPSIIICQDFIWNNVPLARLLHISPSNGLYPQTYQPKTLLTFLSYKYVIKIYHTVIIMPPGWLQFFQPAQNERLTRDVTYFNTSLINMSQLMNHSCKPCRLNSFWMCFTFSAL